MAVVAVNEPRAEALLAGPRGRALSAAAAGLDTLSLLNALSRPVAGSVLRSIGEANATRPGWPPPGWDELCAAADAGTPPSVAEVVARHVATVDLDALSSTRDPMEFVGVLAEAVDDRAFSDDELVAAALLGEARDALAPVADALVQAPAAAWWWDPVDLGAQRWIGWAGRAGPPTLTGAAQALRDDADSEATDKVRSADLVPFPPGPEGPRFSGRWWSAPLSAGLIGTTRALPGLPAAQLAVCEDCSGDDRPVEVWQVDIDPSARVYEVDGPDAWCALTEAFPRDVTVSRRHDWWRWTGWEGTWLIPDWSALSTSYDGVHVSVAGYLSASYRALPVADGARTCLAGWDPDETIWLTDVLVGSELVVRFDHGIGRNLLSG